MKKFFKDYWEIMKLSGKFCKEHWVGMMVFTVVLTGTELALINSEGTKELIVNAKNKIKSKFHKDEA